jgi:hypothetical protein
MERPKQQALAFLLGALLVGGVLGFSADRVFRQDELTPAQRRAQFYEDIGITAQQRPVLDSLLDARKLPHGQRREDLPAQAGFHQDRLARRNGSSAHS